MLACMLQSCSKHKGARTTFTETFTAAIGEDGFKPFSTDDKTVE